MQLQPSQRPPDMRLGLYFVLAASMFAAIDTLGRFGAWWAKLVAASITPMIGVVFMGAIILAIRDHDDDWF